MRPNPEPREYPAWNSAAGRFGRGLGTTNFVIGSFSLAQFRAENAFMAEPFKLKHGIDFEAGLFAIWAAAFFGSYVGITMHPSTWAERRDRTMNNFTNLMFRGYTMVRRIRILERSGSEEHRSQYRTKPAPSASARSTVR